jgi:hypothetical protein
MDSRPSSYEACEEAELSQAYREFMEECSSKLVWFEASIIPKKVNYFAGLLSR